MCRLKRYQSLLGFRRHFHTVALVEFNLAPYTKYQSLLGVRRHFHAGSGRCNLAQGYGKHVSIPVRVQALFPPYQPVHGNLPAGCLCLLVSIPVRVQASFPPASFRPPLKNGRPNWYQSLLGFKRHFHGFFAFAVLAYSFTEMYQSLLGVRRHFHGRPQPVLDPRCYRR